MAVNDLEATTGCQGNEYNIKKQISILKYCKSASNLMSACFFFGEALQSKLLALGGVYLT